MMITAPQIASGGGPSSGGFHAAVARAAAALVPVEMKLVGQAPEGEAPRQEASKPKPEAKESPQESARKANAVLAHSNTHLQFQVGERTGRIVIRIIDTDTKEVIRTIPPEELTRLSERLSELRGLLIDAEG